ncbi:transcription elongation factor SPT6 isoform X1 [Carpediemonas membranifera]|uniref:Transcription elongation factor SPT6 isoform X1 n=1 Tax=Carpediemonas membranifera TaxID=201153 RepID=A0A8J6AS94_9EUKA|nr:transcription elongation factor SPT6 isoform X1 [Carpediemonas membranifera]|eukprot:KAG9393151.1 transcription elongation factor SPT6 isoform X1 [Carpediemonas membranifera]
MSSVSKRPRILDDDEDEFDDFDAYDNIDNMEDLDMNDDVHEEEEGEAVEAEEAEELEVAEAEKIIIDKDIPERMQRRGFVGVKKGWKHNDAVKDKNERTAMEEWVLAMAFPNITIHEARDGVPNYHTDMTLHRWSLNDEERDYLTIPTSYISEEEMATIYGPGDKIRVSKINNAVKHCLALFESGLEPQKIIAFDIAVADKAELRPLTEKMVRHIHNYYLRYLRLRREIDRAKAVLPRLKAFYEHLAETYDEAVGSNLRLLDYEDAEQRAEVTGPVTAPEDAHDLIRFITTVSMPTAGDKRQHRGALNLLDQENLLRTLFFIVPDVHTTRPGSEHQSMLQNFVGCLSQYLSEGHGILDRTIMVNPKASDLSLPMIDPHPLQARAEAHPNERYFINDDKELQARLVEAATELLTVHPDVVREARTYFRRSPQVLVYLTEKGKKTVTETHELSDIFFRHRDRDVSFAGYQQRYVRVDRMIDEVDGRDEPFPWAEFYPVRFPATRLLEPYWRHEPDRSAIALARSNQLSGEDLDEIVNVRNKCAQRDIDMWPATLVARLDQAQKNGLVSIQVVSADEFYDLKDENRSAKERERFMFTAEDERFHRDRFHFMFDRVEAEIGSENLAAWRENKCRDEVTALSFQRLKMLAYYDAGLLVQRRMRREVWSLLLAASRSYITARCRERLTQYIDTRPPRPEGWSAFDAEQSRARSGASSHSYNRNSERIVAVVPAESHTDSTIAVCINGRGEPIDIRRFGYIHHCRSEQEKLYAAEDLLDFIRFIDAKCRPSVIAIEDIGSNTDIIRELIEKPIERYLEYSGVALNSVLGDTKLYTAQDINSPAIISADGTLAKIMAASNRVRSAVPEMIPDAPSRRAFLLAVSVLNPLAALATVMGSADDAMCLPLHELQSTVPSSTLYTELEDELVYSVAKVGVEARRALGSSAFERAVVRFIPGLGPLKAKAVLHYLPHAAPTVQSIFLQANMMAEEAIVPWNASVTFHIHDAGRPRNKRELQKANRELLPFFDAIRLERTTKDYYAAYCIAAAYLEHKDIMSLQDHRDADGCLNAEASTYTALSQTMADGPGQGALNDLKSLRRDDRPRFNEIIKEICVSATLLASENPAAKAVITEEFAIALLEECSSPYEDHRPPHKKLSARFIGGVTRQQFIRPSRATDVGRVEMSLEGTHRWIPRQFLDEFGRFENLTSSQAIMKLMQLEKGSYIVRPSAFDGYNNDRERRTAIHEEHRAARYFLDITVKIESDQLYRHIHVEELEKTDETAIGTKLVVQDPFEHDDTVYEGIDDLCASYIEPLVENYRKVYSHRHYWDAASDPHLADHQDPAQGMRQAIGEYFYSRVFSHHQPATVAYVIVASRRFVGSFEIWLALKKPEVGGMMQNGNVEAWLNLYHEIFTPTAAGWHYRKKHYDVFDSASNSLMAEFKRFALASLTAPVQRSNFAAANTSSFAGAGFTATDGHFEAARRMPQPTTAGFTQLQSGVQASPDPGASAYGYVHPARM